MPLAHAVAAKCDLGDEGYRHGCEYDSGSDYIDVELLAGFVAGLVPGLAALFSLPAAAPWRGLRLSSD